MSPSEAARSAESEKTGGAGAIEATPPLSFMAFIVGTRERGGGDETERDPDVISFRHLKIPGLSWAWGGRRAI